MGPAWNRGPPLTVPGRVTIRERVAVLTLTTVLCVIVCWRARGRADGLAPHQAEVPRRTWPGHLPAWSRRASGLAGVLMPDAG